MKICKNIRLKTHKYAMIKILLTNTQYTKLWPIQHYQKIPSIHNERHWIMYLFTTDDISRRHCFVRTLCRSLLCHFIFCRTECDAGQCCTTGEYITRIATSLEAFSSATAKDLSNRIIQCNDSGMNTTEFWQPSFTGNVCHDAKYWAKQMSDVLITVKK